MVQCKKCGKKFKNNAGLAGHARNCKGAKKGGGADKVRVYKCKEPGCNYETVDRYSLAGHVGNKHQKKKQETIIGDGPPYRCGFCGKEYDKPGALYSHRHAHHREEIERGEVGKFAGKRRKRKKGNNVPELDLSRGEATLAVPVMLKFRINGEFVGLMGEAGTVGKK